jgi:hypothetical protein
MGSTAPAGGFGSPDPQRLWQLYRAGWTRIMVAVVMLGLVSVVADAILRYPRISAAGTGLGIAAWCAVRAHWRTLRAPELTRGPVDDDRAGDVLCRLWSRTPFEARLLVTAIVGVWTAVGLGLVLGTAGEQLLAAAGVFGLPLLLPPGESGAPHGLEAVSAAQWPAVPDAVPPGPGDAPWACGDPPSYADCLELSVSELLEIWRASSRALAGRLDPAQRSRVAAARSRYLDALQALDPDGVAAWLSSRHAQDSDPARFLNPTLAHRRRDHQPPGSGHGRPPRPSS